MAQTGDYFDVGDKVPHSGIYDVLHDKHHPQKHQVTCIFGRTFPPCRGCGHNVQFRLSVKALHITADPAFKKRVRNPLG